MRTKKRTIDAQTVEKGKAFSDERLQSAVAHKSPPRKTDDLHVCGLRSIFCHAHVAAENKLDFFRTL